MENTLEDKARFFAQYWGQNIVLTKNNKQYGNVNGYLLDTEYALKNTHLELTPLEQISDEDATEIANLINHKYWHTFTVFRRDNIEEIQILFEDKDGDSYSGRIVIDKNCITWVDCDEVHESPYELAILNAYDYLRQKGYALPYLNLSVEEQIKRGWVKLKNNTNN